jgi:hypothetical protein
MKNIKVLIVAVMILLSGFGTLATVYAQGCGTFEPPQCAYLIESHYGSSGGVLKALEGGMTEEVLDSCAADNQTLKEVTCGPDETVIIEYKFCELGCNNGACYSAAWGLGFDIIVSSSAKHLELDWADAIYALGYEVTLKKESGEFISKTEVQDSYILLDGLKGNTEYIILIVPFNDAGARSGLMIPAKTD